MLDLYDKCKNDKMLHFVTDFYKRMTPVGLEIFGPMLRTLAEDTLVIKKLLPDFLDI